ncbi:MAG: hypothetical protein OXF75_02535 [Acidimicrobiaceae bacterium]|nr:hypothetical protein [Acidimicrobiaceae bacterium]
MDRGFGGHYVAGAELDRYAQLSYGQAVGRGSVVVGDGQLAGAVD